MFMGAYHSTKPPRRKAVLSLMSQAAGSPVTRVASPRIRNAQAGPARRMRGSNAMLRTAPPRPPQATTTPFANPRLRLKYCAGVLARTFTIIISAD